MSAVRGDASAEGSTTTRDQVMQEGCVSLMQMAKTSAAVARLSEEGILFISFLTDPTYGGVSASYASLGDVLISEPGAHIGFRKSPTTSPAT